MQFRRSILPITFLSTTNQEVWQVLDIYDNQSENERSTITTNYIFRLSIVDLGKIYLIRDEQRIFR